MASNWILKKGFIVQERKKRFAESAFDLVSFHPREQRTADLWLWLFRRFFLCFYSLFAQELQLSGFFSRQRQTLCSLIKAALSLGVYLHLNMICICFLKRKL